MIGLGINLRGKLLSSASGGFYAVQYLNPTVTADFVREKYRGAGANTFDELFDYTSENSTATMVDSDGKMKWAPHNFLKQSVLIANGSYWDHNQATLVTGYTDPFGNTTASLLMNNSTDARDKPRFYNDRLSLNDIPAIDWADSFTFSIYAKASGVDWVKLRHASSSVFDGVFFNVTTGTVGTADSGYTGTIVDCGNGWYKCSITTDTRYDFVGAVLAPSDGDVTWDAGEAVDGEGIIFYGPHFYVSSLGGMVGLPDVADDNFKSYVPTGTSLSTSKPRRNHHAYNGYSWVNQGILIESKDQRTNLIYPSNDIDDVPNTSWFSSNLTFTSNAATGPDGKQSLTKITADTQNVSHVNTFDSADTTSPLTLSCFVRAVPTSTVNHVILRLYSVQNHNINVVYDVRNGQVTYTEAQGDGNIYNYGSEDWGNGLYRIFMTGDIGLRSIINARISLSDTATPTLSGFGAYPFAGAGNDTTAVYAGFFQLETAEASGDIPYPSSYIPTIAGTVTRGEETLSVDFKKLGAYPKSTLTGSNLISGDPNDWTVTFGSNGMIAAGNGFDIVDNNDVLYAEQAITTVAGTTYEISVKLVGDLSTNARIWAGTTTSLSQDVTGFQANAAEIKDFYNGILKGYFTAVGTTTYITISTNDDSGGFRDFNVQEVTDVGIAFDFKGAFSATDNGRTREVCFLERNQVEAGEANDEHFQLFMSTASVDTGQVFAQKVVNGVGSAQSVTSAAYLATPQINLPISIAGINKVDLLRLGRYGGAQSSDTTSLMPSILYSKLNVAPIYDGTISQVRYFRNAPDSAEATWLEDATKPSEEPSMSLTFEAADDRSFVDTAWRVY